MTLQKGGIDQKDFRDFRSEIDEAIKGLENACEELEDGKKVSISKMASIGLSLLRIKSQLKVTLSLLNMVRARHPQDPEVDYTARKLNTISSELQNLADMKGVKFQSLGNDQWMKPDIQKEVRGKLNQFLVDCRAASLIVSRWE